MKQIFKFNRDKDLPIVVAKISSNNRTRNARLIFDTGAACTQFNTAVIDFLGCSAAQGEKMVSAYGPAGPIQEGYTIKLKEIEVLGKKFSTPLVAAYDYDNFADGGIDGLLGFDLIKEFHLEMHGPKGELIVFDD